MKGISVIINTRNEEKNIGRCLESAGFADELIVVDMESQDRTVSIAQSYTQKIFHISKTRVIEEARNDSIAKATQPWVFILDADEVITASLREELVRTAAGGQHNAYFVPERNLVFGKWLKHGWAWPDYHIRFFRRGTVTYSGMVHETPKVKNTIGYLINPIHHYHYSSVQEFLEKNRRYAQVKAQTFKTQGRRVSFLAFISKPMLIFIYGYLYKLGFLDGVAGLKHALLVAHQGYLWRRMLRQLT